MVFRDVEWGESNGCCCYFGLFGGEKKFYRWPVLIQSLFPSRFFSDYDRFALALLRLFLS